eukprot:403331384
MRSLNKDKLLNANSHGNNGSQDQRDNSRLDAIGRVNMQSGNNRRTSARRNDAHLDDSPAKESIANQRNLSQANLQESIRNMQFFNKRNKDGVKQKIQLQMVGVEDLETGECRSVDKASKQFMMNSGSQFFGASAFSPKTSQLGSSIGMRNVRKQSGLKISRGDSGTSLGEHLSVAIKQRQPPTSTKSTQFFPKIEEKTASFQKKQQKIKHQIFKEEQTQKKQENGVKKAQYASADLRNVLPEIKNETIHNRKKSSFAAGLKIPGHHHQQITLEQAVLINVVKPKLLDLDHDQEHYHLNDSAFSDDEQPAKIEDSLLEFMQRPFHKSLNGEDFLEGHQIQAEHRARMVDWMIQVFRVLKVSSAQTFFLAVTIMDQYFNRARLLGLNLERKELHLTGLVSVFLSSKYEDVIPIHMSQILRDAGHNKYDRIDVLTKEKEILTVLKFNIHFQNIYEEACIVMKNSWENFNHGKLLAHDEKFMYQFMLLMAEIVLHSAQLSAVHINVIAKSLALMSLQFMKRYFRHQIENKGTTMTNQLRISQSRLNINRHIDNTLSPNKNAQNNDPAHKYTLLKRFIRYFKGQAFDFNDNIQTFKSVIKNIQSEYKNYLDKVYGLKNLERSFQEFFAEEFQKIILQ